MRTNRKTYAIPTEQIRPFENQPYQVRDDAEMDALVESIQENGIMEPLKLRWIGTPEQRIYEVVSGHRRLHAAILAGMDKVPAVIYDMTKEEAAIMLVDSNLYREHILPSEKAFAYRLKLEAIAEQGKRTDLTSGQVVPKCSRDEISESDSGRQVQRYIRLTELIPEILTMVDSGKIALTPAVELSYLTEQEQRYLLETMESEDRTPSLAQAQKLKQLSQAGELDMDSIFDLMRQQKPNQKECLKLKPEKFDYYLGRLRTPQDKEEFLLKALDHYTRYLRQQRERDER